MGSIVLLCIVILACGLYFRIRSDVKGLWKGLFGNKSIKQVMNEQTTDFQDTPKSLFGMESTYKSLIEKDFPDLNLNELKAMAENYIIKYLDCIEHKDVVKFDYASDKMNSLLASAIDDLGNDVVSYDSIKIHKTILNRYEKNKGLATMKFQTSLEYRYQKNNGEYKKIQDRITTEFIYIIDAEQVSKSSKALGLNCPNCGAPVKNIGEKYCDYCGSGIKDIVKKTWILNNISQ